MTIHHAVKSQAERLGFNLEERDELVMAYHPKSAVQIFGVSAKDAVSQMTKFINIMDRDPDYRFQYDNQDKRIGWVRDATSGKRSVEVGTPTELYKLWGSHKLRWATQAELDAKSEADARFDSPEREPDEDKVVDNIEDTFTEDQHPKDPPTSDASAPIKRNDKGVPLDGATAYAEGIMAADNPHPEGSEEGDLWDTQWDQAADEAPEDTGGKGGSVVAGKYRTLYAERGHPTHCGDWLAELLNNYCVGDKNTDLVTFERICGLNGVDTGKYKRDGIGWQGRIRMTGRNLLAKRVFAAGKITLPGIGDEPEHTVDAPADWMAAQRFAKPATEAAK
jgi:hypothetical protein